MRSEKFLLYANFFNLAALGGLVAGVWLSVGASGADVTFRIVNWFDGRMAAFDIETTGTAVESDRIVTAAVSLVGGGEETASRSWLVNPGVPIPAEATEVHKITNEMALSEGMPAAEAVEEITAILAGVLAEEIPIVAFNGRFDLTILDREARRHGVEPLVDRVGGMDGLLVIDLVREVPEAMKPKKILVGGQKTLEVVENKGEKDEGAEKAA
mgnify:CR=1 FL=1